MFDDPMLLAKESVVDDDDTITEDIYSADKEDISVNESFAVKNNTIVNND